MFAVGDYVISGNNGICLLQDITTLNIGGVDSYSVYSRYSLNSPC